MKIALAQIKVELNKPDQNVKKMLHYINELGNSIDVIAFPEMCIGGYFLSDKLTETNFCLELERYNPYIVEMSNKFPGLVIIWGNIKIMNIDSTLKNKDGRLRKYNSAYIAENGLLYGINKTLLPTYREFDDSRYFSSNSTQAIKPFKSRKGFSIGVELCEDLWCSDYSINPTQILFDKGADVIINISASPFSVNKFQARDNSVKKLYCESHVPFFYVNCVGVQNNGKNIITFDGDSRIYNEKGEKQENISLAPYEEGIICGEVSNKKLVSSHIFLGRHERPITQMTPIKQKFDAIIESLKYMHEISGNKKFIIGLSGGIDSALSAALSTIAIGKENLIAYNLPNIFNSEKTKDIAKLCAKNLGIVYKIIPIEELCNATINSLVGIPSDLVWENVQSKIRGLILTTEAQINDGIVISNGNKVEIATGYFTLYGDSVGAISPLGDLLKIEVFEMSKYINETYGNLIPEDIIPDKKLNFKIAPSAELKVEQIDPFQWGIDDKLIELLMNYNKYSMYEILLDFSIGVLHSAGKWDIPPEYFRKWGYDNTKASIEKFCEHLEWFVNLIYNSTFKRVQTPPIPILSKSAFGYDYRESILPNNIPTNYWALKRELLEEKK
jgi:NAD+ synthase (glutamine-hydrolysing)